MKYLDVTYVKISNFKVAVAVSQTCEEHSICLYMNLQTLALKQFCIYNKPNNKNIERTICILLCERQTQGYNVIVVSLARVHFLGSRTLLKEQKFKLC